MSPCHRGICEDYRIRRDWVLDLLFENFDIEEELQAGHSVFLGYPKRSTRSIISDIAPTGVNGQERKGGHSSEKPLGSETRKPLFQLVPPTAGMFLWFQVRVLGRIRNSLPSF